MLRRRRKSSKRRKLHRSMKVGDPARDLTTLLNVIGVAEKNISKASRVLDSRANLASFSSGIAQSFRTVSRRLDEAFNAIDDLGAEVEMARDNLRG